MVGFKIPEVNEVIVGELAERGEWVVANVYTNSSWPIQSRKVQYRGEVLWIVPIMKDRFPAVAMKVRPGKSRGDCERLLMRFLSNLAWVEEAGFLVDGIGGGSLPSPMGRKNETGFSICDEFELSYFPEPTGDKALLALALMREGCESAWGPDADRHTKLLINREAEGSLLEAYLQSRPQHQSRTSIAAPSPFHSQGEDASDT